MDDPNLRHKICEKNAMYKATLSCPQNKELLIEYQKNKHSLNSQLKNTEILYYSNELDINKHDASKSWKIFKKISLENKVGIIGRKKVFSIPNVIIDNSAKIANEFNNFFVSIGHYLEKDSTCNVNPLFYVNSVNYSIVVYLIKEGRVIVMCACVHMCFLSYIL